MEKKEENYQVLVVEENNFGEGKASSEGKKVLFEEERKKSSSNHSGKEKRDSRRFPHSHIKSETLATKRVVKVTKGGRRFSFTSLVLIKDEEKNAVAFAHSGGKEVIVAFRKSFHKGQKKLINYFPSPVRTIPQDIVVSYKATKLFLKPTPPGSGIKASGALSILFKYLGIKDMSAKIIGSRRNKLNVIRAAFLALDKLTGKKYEY
ncbi:MAG: hypothetical protein NY202_01510 [Mollicutes bacterium UO1]